MSSNSEVALFNQTLELDTSLTKLWQELQLARQQQPDAIVEADGVPLFFRRPYTSGDLYVASLSEINTNVQTATSHFEKLRDCGAYVVSFAMEPRKGLRPAKTRRPDTVFAYAATCFVEDSVSLDKLTPETLPKQEVSESVITPINRYLDWRKKTCQSYILADIYHSDQYSLHSASGTIFLHDIDPYLMDTKEQVLGSVDEEVQQLYDLAKQIAD